MNDQMTAGSQPLPMLQFDGPMFGGWLQFTELDPASPSFTASFYLKVDQFSLAALTAKRAEKQSQFSETLAR